MSNHIQGLDLDLFEDARYRDELDHSPGSPSWIFFDDHYDPQLRQWDDQILAGREDAAARKDWSWEKPDPLPQAYQLAQYDTRYDPVAKRNREVETTPIPIDYNEKMAHLSKAYWLQDWYKRSAFQRGEVGKTALRKILAAELHGECLNPEREEGTPAQYAPFKGDESDPVDTSASRERNQYQEYMRERLFRVLRPLLRKIRMDQFAAEPPSGTVFLNPDGTRLSTQGKSPIQGKIAFLNKHKPANFRFEFEGRMVEGKDEADAVRKLRPHFGPQGAAKFVREALTQKFPAHPLDESQVMVEKVTRENGSSYYFIAKRIPSDQRPSNYYDPDPTFREIKTEQGWESRYVWTSGILKRIPTIKQMARGSKRDEENMKAIGHKAAFEQQYLSMGAHVLSIRDLEMAILSGANFADSYADWTAADIGDNALVDARERGIDDKRMRHPGSLAYDEAYLYGLCMQLGLESIAEAILEQPEDPHMLATMLTQNGRISLFLAEKMKKHGITPPKRDWRDFLSDRIPETIEFLWPGETATNPVHLGKALARKNEWIRDLKHAEEGDTPLLLELIEAIENDDERTGDNMLPEVLRLIFPPLTDEEFQAIEERRIAAIRRQNQRTNLKA